MLTGGSRDLTVRATHAPLERTNAVAPPSCPPAGRSGGENRARRNVRSHGTLGMWQQFPQQRSNENLRVRLVGDNWRQRLTQKARGVDEIAPRCIRRCQKISSGVCDLLFGIAKRKARKLPSVAHLDRDPALSSAVEVSAGWCWRVDSQFGWRVARRNRRLDHVARLINTAARVFRDTGTTNETEVCSDSSCDGVWGGSLGE